MRLLLGSTWSASHIPSTPSDGSPSGAGRPSAQPPERHSTHPLRGYLFIAAATLCWGISATLGRAVFTGRLISPAHQLHPIDPLILAQTRTTISFLVLAPVLLLRRGIAGLALRRSDLLRCALLGILGIAGSNYFYYLAIQKTNVATAIILQYTAPIWVLLYMAVSGFQRATLRRVFSVLLAVTGSALAIGAIGSGRFRVNAVGVVAAQLAAVAFALYNVLGARLVSAYDRWRVLASAMGAAAVFWLFVNPPWTILAAHYSWQQWLFLVVFALTSVLAPFSFYFAGLQYLDPTRAIVTSCLEPVFSIVIAAIALSELLGPSQIAGMIMVLVATILVQTSGAGKQELVVEPME
jgi:drug/metabolite transporter, DME family